MTRSIFKREESYNNLKTGNHLQEVPFVTENFIELPVVLSEDEVIEIVYLIVTDNEQISDAFNLYANVAEEMKDEDEWSEVNNGMANVIQWYKKTSRSIREKKRLALCKEFFCFYVVSNLCIPIN
ncbi:hypothetical protein IMZ31_22410 (plasmid) [Pontibacillus sp. ALD_SL1]|uniref:hypothetical protein n=1 Tax=Pontibacillus sp. ALD_SL1 TaxID=2777185 RepID=UPI001A95EEB3|nr:hypothetical protein [Pontibacillus sp. ALD_SL1]QST02209.1 hypothetical protein IMZ31_22410 [Pontibacillus sp. ALD_SL1]